MSKLSNELYDAITGASDASRNAQAVVADAFTSDGKIKVSADGKVSRFGDLKTTVDSDGITRVTSPAITAAHTKRELMTQLPADHPDHVTSVEYTSWKRNLNNKLRRAAKSRDLPAFQVRGKGHGNYFVAVSDEAAEAEVKTFDSELRKLVAKYVKEGSDLPTLETVSVLVFTDLLDSITDAIEESIAA